MTGSPAARLHKQKRVGRRATGPVFRASWPQKISFLNNVAPPWTTDRKSTRLNSSHLGISYAVFCLKKNERLTASRHAGGRKPAYTRKRFVRVPCGGCRGRPKVPLHAGACSRTKRAGVFFLNGGPPPQTSLFPHRPSLHF